MFPCIAIAARRAAALAAMHPTPPPAGDSGREARRPRARSRAAAWGIGQDFGLHGRSSVLDMYPIRRAGRRIRAANNDAARLIFMAADWNKKRTFRRRAGAGSNRNSLLCLTGSGGREPGSYSSGQPYRVTQRGSRLAPAFLQDGDYALYFDLLVEAAANGAGAEGACCTAMGVMARVTVILGKTNL